MVGKSFVNIKVGLGAFALRLGTTANATVDGRERLGSFVYRGAGVDTRRRKGGGHLRAQGGR